MELTQFKMVISVIEIGTSPPMVLLFGTVELDGLWVRKTARVDILVFSLTLMITSVPISWAGTGPTMYQPSRKLLLLVLVCPFTKRLKAGDFFLHFVLFYSGGGKGCDQSQ